MDIIGVSETHEIVIISIAVAAAVLLLGRQFYRMAKGKSSGCPSCSQACGMKDDAPPCTDDNDVVPQVDDNDNDNIKT